MSTMTDELADFRVPIRIRPLYPTDPRLGSFPTLPSGDYFFSGLHYDQFYLTPRFVTIVPFPCNPCWDGQDLQDERATATYEVFLFHVRVCLVMYDLWMAGTPLSINAVGAQLAHREAQPIKVSMMEKGPEPTEVADWQAHDWAAYCLRWRDAPFAGQEMLVSWG